LVSQIHKLHTYLAKAACDVDIVSKDVVAVDQDVCVVETDPEEHPTISGYSFSEKAKSWLIE
jgi:hypothetical protein